MSLFNCTVCRVEFDRASSLVEHLKETHIPTTAPSLSSSPSPPPPPTSPPPIRALARARSPRPLALDAISVVSNSTRTRSRRSSVSSAETIRTIRANSPTSPTLTPTLTPTLRTPRSPTSPTSTRRSCLSPTRQSKRCVDCDRTFLRDKDLFNHLRDSPKHRFKGKGVASPTRSRGSNSQDSRSRSVSPLHPNASGSMSIQVQSLSGDKSETFEFSESGGSILFTINPMKNFKGRPRSSSVPTTGFTPPQAVVDAPPTDFQVTPGASLAVPQGVESHAWHTLSPIPQSPATITLSPRTCIMSPGSSIVPPQHLGIESIFQMAEAQQQRRVPITELTASPAPARLVDVLPTGLITPEGLEISTNSLVASPAPPSNLPDDLLSKISDMNLDLDPLIMRALNSVAAIRSSLNQRLDALPRDGRGYGVEESGSPLSPQSNPEFIFEEIPVTPSTVSSVPPSPSPSPSPSATANSHASNHPPPPSYGDGSPAPPPDYRSPAPNYRSRSSSVGRDEASLSLLREAHAQSPTSVSPRQHQYLGSHDSESESEGEGGRAPSFYSAPDEAHSHESILHTSIDIPVGELPSPSPSFLSDFDGANRSWNIGTPNTEFNWHPPLAFPGVTSVGPGMGIGGSEHPSPASTVNSAEMSDHPSQIWNRWQYAQSEDNTKTPTNGDTRFNLNFQHDQVQEIVTRQTQTPDSFTRRQTLTGTANTHIPFRRTLSTPLLAGPLGNVVTTEILGAGGFTAPLTW